MPLVTGNVRTWGFNAYSAGERLLIEFVPSQAAAGNGNVLPLRVENVEPGTDGSFSVNLAQTTNLLTDVYYTVRFSWFSQDPVTGAWLTRGWSELREQLRVPAAGGVITSLLTLLPRPGSTLYGYGPPPSSLRGVTYFDVSGMKPKMYAPKGTLV